MTVLNSAAKAAGTAAEQDARWYIDRTFHESRNWRVLHDVLLADPRSDSWCQIDHVVFGRLGYFLVLETKSAVEGMSLHTENGAWSVWHGGRLKPVKSPIAQNERHIEVLRDFLKEHQVMPKRLFVTIPPSFENWILVQPGARLPKQHEGARIVQRDQFSQEFERFLERMPDSSMLKVMSGLELDSIAGHLEAASSQNKILRGRATSACITGSSAVAAALCEEAPAIPDLGADERFAPPLEGKSIGTPIARCLPTTTANGRKFGCAKCERELTVKEVNYCRFNFAKMGRKYLCRQCQ